MDEPGPLKVCARDRSLLVLAGCLLFIAALFPACTSSEPKFISPAAPASFSETVKNVAQTRGLEPKQEIKLADGASPGNAPALPPIDFYNGAPLLEVERVYKIIGLLPNTSDFGKAVAEYRLLERFITYDRATSSVSWTAGAPQAGAPLAQLNADKAREFVPVFAIVQALQEQHFRWRATIDKVSLEDRRSAFLALAAGDAALTLLTTGVKKEDVKSHAGATRHRRTSSRTKSTNSPRVYRTSCAGSSLFPTAMAAHLFTGHSGLKVGEESMGFTLTHRFRRRKFFIRKNILSNARHRCVSFPPNCCVDSKKALSSSKPWARMRSSACSSRDGSTKLLLDIAAGWRGDQLFAFPESSNPTIIWFSSWRTEDQAQDFFHAYRGVLEARHRVRFDHRPVKKTAR